MYLCVCMFLYVVSWGHHPFPPPLCGFSWHAMLAQTLSAQAERLRQQEEASCELQMRLRTKERELEILERTVVGKLDDQAVQDVVQRKVCVGVAPIPQHTPAPVHCCPLSYTHACSRPQVKKGAETDDDCKALTHSLLPSPANLCPCSRTCMCRSTARRKSMACTLEVQRTCARISAHSKHTLIHMSSNGDKLVGVNTSHSTLCLSERGGVFVGTILHFPQVLVVDTTPTSL